MANQTPAVMPCFIPAVPPALAAAAAGGRIKKRAGLPKLLHKLFIKVLRLRPPVEPTMSTAFEAFYSYRMAGSDDEEEYCYCYSYGSGVAGSSWAGVLSSIPEEEVDDSSEDSSEPESSPDVVIAPAGADVLRKVKSEQFVVGPPEAATTVVHVEVLL